MDAPLSQFMDSGRTLQLYNRDSEEIPQILPKVVATSWKLRQSSISTGFREDHDHLLLAVSVSLQFQVMGWRCCPNSWPKILRTVRQLDLMALVLGRAPVSLGSPRCLQPGRTLFRAHSVSGVHVWGFTPKDCSLTSGKSQLACGHVVSSVQSRHAADSLVQQTPASPVHLTSAGAESAFS